MTYFVSHNPSPQPLSHRERGVKANVFKDPSPSGRRVLGLKVLNNVIHILLKDFCSRLQMIILRLPHIIMS